jgi:hypothetical protein
MGGFDACRVTDLGVSHLFAPLQLGRRCACGRKIAVVDTRGVLDIQDVPPLFPRGELLRGLLRGLLR